MYIYVDSEPIGEYKSLGQVKSTVAVSTQYQNVRSRLLKKTKKKYGNEADAIIIYFNNNGADIAEVIQFVREE